MPPSELDLIGQKAQEAWCLGSVLMEQHILHLYFDHHLTLAEISRRTDMAEDTIKSMCAKHAEKNLETSS